MYFGDSSSFFKRGTFRFRLVCRRWDKAAVEFPRLWVRWPPCAVGAWPLFSARSKGAPLYLTWRPICATRASEHTPLDPAIPGRVRELDFSGGTNEALEDLLGAFDSSRPSEASSIRVRITPYDERAGRKHTTDFFSMSFPKLSNLNLENFLPDFSSPVFTTSNLISLKLAIPHGKKSRCNRSQFSQILQHHPNLQELHLRGGGIPQVESSGPSAPFVLPRLADLQLDGTMAMIAGFMDLVGTSSPLHNIIINFEFTRAPSVSRLAGIVKKILTSYYECQGLDCPRKADQLTIVSDSADGYVVFKAKSESTSASHSESDLRLRFSKAGATLVEKICLVFPLDDVREFNVVGLDLPRIKYRRILRKMGDLSHLWLDHLDLGPVLGALSFDHKLEGKHEKFQEPTLGHSYVRR